MSELADRLAGIATTHAAALPGGHRSIDPARQLLLPADRQCGSVPPDIGSASQQLT